MPQHMAMPAPLNVEEDVQKASELIKQTFNRNEIHKSSFWKFVDQDLSFKQHFLILFPAFAPILTKYFIVMDQQVKNKIFKFVFGKEGTEFERFWNELLKECEQYIRYDERTHKISILFYDPIHNVKLPQRSKIVLYLEKYAMTKNDPAIISWKREFQENKQIICEYDASHSGPTIYVFETAAVASIAEKKLQALFPNLPFAEFCQIEEENIYVTMDELSRKSYFYR